MISNKVYPGELQVNGINTLLQRADKLKVELQQHRNLSSHEILEALYLSTRMIAIVLRGTPHGFLIKKH
jgi:hypothetical protein